MEFHRYSFYLIIFIFGFLIVNFLYNPKKKQLKYPTGSNDENFIDDKGVCYKYKKVYL